ncbi:MAG: peptide chain release factor N(5)-glutamine methyltransferase [Anaerolineae bacterium]|nr:peptide chain release factor N(5)-glutamine methyltransferase [Anaerolineae bacterium]
MNAPPPGGPVTVGAALRAAAAAFAESSASPQLDAQSLLGHLLGMERAALLAHPERVLTPEQAQAYATLVRCHANGTPIAYLTGRRAFYRHEFAVTPDVLIPRPETEHLVDAARTWAQHRQPHGDGLTVLDVGTGSGIIALSLAAVLPRATVHATDISPAALDVARGNAARLGLDNVQFHLGSLLDALPAAVRPDLVTANLPYIASDALRDLEVARHEPRLALDGGPDGLDLIRLLLDQLPARLLDSFCLLLEIAAGQGEAVRELCARAFPHGIVRVLPDYAGLDRVVETTRAGGGR